MLSFVSPLMTLLSLVGASTAQQFGACDYIQELEQGKQYYVFNPNYPQSYPPGITCRWIARSDRPIKLSCDPFQLPVSDKCRQDAVIIQDSSDSVGHRYCGNGNLNVVSQSNQLTITLLTSASSRSGKFLCTVETASRDEDLTNCRCGWKNPSAPTHKRIVPDGLWSPGGSLGPDAKAHPGLFFFARAINTRIVGGEETGVNEFPMMAGLVDLSQRMLFCGATIINEKQVLTAAHCVATRSILGIGVLVGDHDLSRGDETNATHFYRVSSVTVHPQYNVSTFDNDIALVTINGSMTFNAQVGPVCLPFQHYPDTFAGNYVDVLGWGSTEFAGPVSNTLQKVKLSVITNIQCKKTYRDLTSRQMCTYTRGKDSCQFDSGGPVLWQNPTTRRIVEIGLISQGGACADTDPASNTRVGAMVNWIEANTPGGLRYCKIE